MLGCNRGLRNLNKRAAVCDVGNVRGNVYRRDGSVVGLSELNVKATSVEWELRVGLCSVMPLFKLTKHRKWLRLAKAPVPTSIAIAASSKAREIPTNYFL